MIDYCRVLNTDMEVERFVDGVLCISGKIEKRSAINKICSAERNISSYSYFPTLTHRDNRDFEWREDSVRFELRNTIINELFTLKRMAVDDDICLGVGGAAPNSQVMCERKVFCLIGPPASGKSCVASKVAELYGAFILDSDYAKRKLPEYTNQIGAASLVHDESSDLVYNLNKDSLMYRCVQNGSNMVVPKIGDDFEKLLSFVQLLTSANFFVYLISIELDRQKSAMRAYERFDKTGRYVPLSLIFDKYGNQPTLNYFKMKQKYSNMFSGFAQISTDVPRYSPFVLVEQENMKELTSIVWKE